MFVTGNGFLLISLSSPPLKVDTLSFFFNGISLLNGQELELLSSLMAAT